MEQLSSHIPFTHADYGVTSSTLISGHKLHAQYQMRSLSCDEYCLYAPERLTTMSTSKYSGKSNPDEYLSEEDLLDIAKAKDDIQHGRVYTTAELMRKLGL